MSDHDDSAERAPAGGVPEWHRPIEYNEGLEDDDDEGVPEDLPDQRPQPNLFWFKDFNDKFETFDFNTAVAFRGKYHPHHDKILYNIPDDRWVLGALDYLPGTATPPGVLPTTEDEDIEVSREFATFFITKNDHILPDRLGELADPRYPLRDHRRCCTNNSCFSKDLRQTTSPICGFLGGLLAVTS